MMHEGKRALFGLFVLAVCADAHAQGIRIEVSRTPEQRAAAFDAADENKDGKLDLAEFKKALPAEVLSRVPDSSVPKIMADRDTDGDGFVSKAEFTAPTS